MLNALIKCDLDIQQGVRAASHVHLVVAELCCGTPCQLPAERWELAGKTQRESSIKSSVIVKSVWWYGLVLKRLYLSHYHKGLDNTLSGSFVWDILFCHLKHMLREFRASKKVAGSTKISRAIKSFGHCQVLSKKV